MNKSTLPVIMGVASIAIIVIAILFTSGIDEKGPEIEFSDECITLFTDNDSTDILLDGVKAYDEKDGDVSDSLRIQSISVISEEGKIVVHYSAKDKDNNIVNNHRSVDYNGTQEYIDFSVLDEEIFADVESDSEVSSDDANNQTESGLNQNETDGQEQTSSGEESNVDEPNSEEETSSRELETEESEPIDREEVNATGIPQIRMEYHEQTIAVGGEFNYMDPLAEWYDDKDDVSRRLIIGGDYDVNVPGTYVLTYYVTDSDGNLSNMEKFTLIVE